MGVKSCHRVDQSRNIHGASRPWFFDRGQIETVAVTLVDQGISDIEAEGEILGTRAIVLVLEAMAP